MVSKDHHLRRQMVIAFHEIPGIGWQSIKKAVDAKLWRYSSITSSMLQSVGFSPVQADITVKAIAGSGAYIDEYSSPAERKFGAAVLTRFDEAYPIWLNEMSQPPWVIYLKGRAELLKHISVSIVGTRVPTASGRSFAERIAEELSVQGLTVVSGLARGIDSSAHTGAMRGVGSTIAVMPTPIDSCYPPENRSLFAQISSGGLLLSETPVGTKLHPGQFPLRNRIIAGLSVGTIVIEGAAKSGSLITAGQALIMNREVFAVPGSPSSPKSEGPNGLIKRGEAKLITCVDDIMEELLWLPEAVRSNRTSLVSGGLAAREEHRLLTPEERIIIQLLHDQPLSINEIHELTRIPFGHLNALLLNLCIKRKIEHRHGALYVVL